MKQPLVPFEHVHSCAGGVHTGGERGKLSVSCVGELAVTGTAGPLIPRSTDGFAKHEPVTVTCCGIAYGPSSGAMLEIGDVCNQLSATLPGTSYVVQRQWSNSRGTCYAPTTGPTFTEPPLIAFAAYVKMGHVFR